MRDPLSVPESVVLHDLREHGAEAPFFLEARLGEAALRRLLDQKLLIRLDETPAGPLVILGPQGRSRLGLRSNYRSPPEIAADQYIRRRCLDVLQAQGWRYLSKERSHRHLLRLVAPNDQRVYLLARWRRFPARTVRRVFDTVRPRLVREHARLLVHTDRPHYLKPLVHRSEALLQVLCFHAS